MKKSFKFAFSILFILGSFQLKAAQLKDPTLYKNISQWNGFDGQQFLLCRIDSNGAMAPNSEKKKVYFSEDSDVVEEKEKKEMLAFFKGLPKYLDTIKVVGHADECGDAQYNMDLSKRRSEAVIHEIGQILPVTRKIPVELKGESESHNHSSHERFVEIEAGAKLMKKEFNNIILLDSSGSLASERSLSGRSFNQFKKMQYNSDTLVYVVVDKRVGCAGNDLKNYYPQGDTFIKEAQGVIATQMKGHANVTVVTDGDAPLRVKDEEVYRRAIQKSLSGENSIKWYFR